MDIDKQLMSMNVNQEKVKSLFKNLLLAYQRHDRRKKTAESVQQQLEKTKEAAIRRAPKKAVEQEFTSLQDMLAAIFDKEKALLAQQREETRMLLELRAKVDDIEKRALQQSTLSPTVDTVQELHAIQRALQKLDAKLDEEASRLAQVRTKEGEETTRMERVAEGERVTERKIMEIEAQLRFIETKHRQLAKKGRSKEQLKRVKRLIEKHKKRIMQLKKVKQKKKGILPRQF